LKTQVTLGIAAVAIFLFLSGYILQSISELKQQNEQLNLRVAELAETPKSNTLDLQEKCAEHAKRAFADWKVFNDPDGTILGKSLSHYNAKLDKCFALFSASKDDNEELVDAYSGKSYGAFQNFQGSGSCYVVQPSGEVKHCERRTIPDFRVLATVYMQEDHI
jgi:hypothetical protein